MSIRHAESKCHRCGKKIDASGHLVDDRLKPKRDDLTVCLYCGQLMIYADDDLRLRKLTMRELKYVMKDTKLWNQIEEIQFAIWLKEQNEK